MKFSKQRPVTPDFYWYKPGNGMLTVMKVFPHPDSLDPKDLCGSAIGDKDWWDLLSRFDGEWAGPLEPPGER